MMGKAAFKYLYHRAKRTLVDAWLLRGRRRRFADTLIIETTNICTLACSCCPNGNGAPLRPRGIMTRETFDRVLEHIDIPVRTCFLHLCGEPFLNPDLEYFCRRLMEKDIRPTVFSNGYGINLGLLDRLLALKSMRIAFSMELHDGVVYDAVRKPGHHVEARKHLEEIDRHFAAANRFYGLNIILAPGTRGDAVIEATRRLFAEFSHLNSITYSSEWPWPGLPATGDIAGHIAAHGPMCGQIRELPVVLWDGRTSFCNLDYAGDMITGNVLYTPLSVLMNNREARRFRRRLLSRSFPAGSLCAHCVLPRCETFSMTQYRTGFRKMTELDIARTCNEVNRYFS